VFTVAWHFCRIDQKATIAAGWINLSSAGSEILVSADAASTSSLACFSRLSNHSYRKLFIAAFYYILWVVAYDFVRTYSS
jgi:hypothetical protein